MVIELLSNLNTSLNNKLSDLQMAQLSTTMSQAHRATAFHFFTSNLFLSYTHLHIHSRDDCSGFTGFLPGNLPVTFKHFRNFETLGYRFNNNVENININLLRNHLCPKYQYILSMTRLLRTNLPTYMYLALFEIILSLPWYPASLYQGCKADALEQPPLYYSGITNKPLA